MKFICRLCLTASFLVPLLLTAFLPITRALPLFRAAKGNCTRRIHDSTLPSFNWSDPTALSLAQECLQSSVPPSDACIFYTSGNRDNAIFYAAVMDRNTIYDVYSPRLFNTTHYPASQWLLNGHLRSVFRTTSRAYAISCSGAATLIIPKDEKPCVDSIWWTDEYDAIRNHKSKITELFRASLLGEASGVWRWIVSAMSLDGAAVLPVHNVKESSPRPQELRRRSWKEVLDQEIDLQVGLKLSNFRMLRDKLAHAMEFGAMADEWPVPSGDSCGIMMR